MKNSKVQKITMCALIMALAYVGFQLLRIDIPVGTERTAIHLGNAFVVLGALLLGPWGGVAGALGLTLADVTSGYLTSAPKTFVLKLVIGFLATAVAKAVRKVQAKKTENVNCKDSESNSNNQSSITEIINSKNGNNINDNADNSNITDNAEQENSINKKKSDNKILGEAKVALFSSIVSLGVNVFLDPIFGYFYKSYIFGIPQDMAATLSKIGSATTLLNAVVSSVVVVIVWPALSKALRKAGLIPLH